MKIRDALLIGAVDRLDAEVLLSWALEKDRTWLLAHPDDSVPDSVAEAYVSCIRRREKGEPVAYITGRKEFYRRSFHVDRSVLIPRPSTEVLVRQAIDILRGSSTQRVVEADSGIVIWTEIFRDPSVVRLLADAGTGSGCIGITLALELPDIRVIATDVSYDALSVARQNACTLGADARMTFVQGNGFDPLQSIKEPFLLVSNPPYIPSASVLERNVFDYEPHQALFGGEQGTNILNPLITAARASPHCMGFAIECRQKQVQPA